MSLILRNEVDGFESNNLFTIWKNRNGGDNVITDRQWNAFIGIVTAIVGNLLISFALNLQRYAHIRLNRDKRRRQRSWVTGKYRRGANVPGYGTQQDLAEERAKANRDAPLMDEEDLDHQTQYHHDEQDEGVATNGRPPSASSNSTFQNGEGEHKTKNYLKSGWWWAGMILMVTGEAGNFLAYGFAPASIVSPLGVVALISNCIIAPCLLKERFRKRDFWGVLIAVGGAVTVVLSAETNEAKLGPHKIWRLISQWEFELYLGLTVSAIVVLMWASGRYGHKSILVDLGLVALFGGYTALTTKGVASLLSDKLYLVFTFPVTYLLVFILIFTALMQIRYLNRALQRFDSTQVIPTQFVLFTLSVIIGSAVLYRDFESATAARFGKFIGGCALTFFGVYCITSGRNQNNDEDGYDDFGGEEGIRLVDEEAQEYGNGHSTTVDSEASVEAGQEENVSSTPPLSRQPSNAPAKSASTPQRMGSYRSTKSSEPFTPQKLDSTLIENPWQSSGESVGSSQSQPELLASSLDDRDGSAHQPSTPSNRSNTAHDLPVSTDKRRTSISRRSMSHLLPGPLSSPLSSSLSGIVHDSIRRSVDGLSRSERKRRSDFARLRLSNRTNSDRVAESESLLPEQTPGEEEDATLKQKRTRSLSVSLGGLFRQKSSRSKSSLAGGGDVGSSANDGERREE